MGYKMFYNLTLVMNAQLLWQSMSRPGVNAEYSCFHVRNMFGHALRPRTEIKQLIPMYTNVEFNHDIQTMRLTKIKWATCPTNYSMQVKPLIPCAQMLSFK